MTLHGAPMLAQSPLTRLRSTTNDTELNAMRAAAWHRHGVASIVVDDITDPWLRQPPPDGALWAGGGLCTNRDHRL